MLVDLDSNQLSYRGEIVDCYPPMLAIFLWKLAKEWPKTVRDTDMAQALWGVMEPADPRLSISVYASQSRKLVRAFGAEIERSFLSYKTGGYRLVLPVA